MAVLPLFEEKHLLDKVAKGDRRAFSVLFEQHHNLVFNIAYKLTRSRLLAKEIVQDVFLKIWNKQADLSEIKNFGAYVNTIARNQTIDALRVLAREALRTVEIEDSLLKRPDYQTEEEIQFRDTSRLIASAVQKLSPQQRKVYQLCHEQGLKYEEAAREMGVSPGTIHSHMKQALKNIRVYLEQADLLLLILLFIFR